MAPLSTQSEVPPGRFRSSLFFLFWLAFVLSGIRPFDPIIWIWMSLPPVLAVMILFGFRQRFLPSKATAAAIFLQCLLLLAGAHFSFHAIPFFRITLPNGLERGYLDWIVHGLDGIVYVLLARDLFRKFIPVTPNPLFRIIAVLCALGIAALWELTEWAAGSASGDFFRMKDGLDIDSYVDMALTLAGGAACDPLAQRPSPLKDPAVTQSSHARAEPASGKLPTVIRPAGETHSRPFRWKGTAGTGGPPSLSG